VPQPELAAPAPRHAPVLGLSHRLLGRFHVTGVFWYRLHYLGARILSPFWSGVVIRIFTTFFFLVMGRIRRSIAANLTPVLGPASWWTRSCRSYRTMHSFAECLSDRYRRAAHPEEVRFTVEGEEYWNQVTAGGRGAILVTAHIGAWDLSAKMGASAVKRTLHVVREEEMDPKAQEFIRDLMSKAGDDVVTHFATDDFRLGLVLREALTRGDVVALQGDRPRANGRVVETRLFGRPFPIPAGPATLARAVGVPLLPVFNFREGMLRTHLVVRPPVYVATTGKRDEDVARAAHQLAREIEWAIRERPYQWFCFRNLWPS
jgi:KDO2-lipid IV(A) lauroyltransferase